MNNDELPDTSADNARCPAHMDEDSWKQIDYAFG